MDCREAESQALLDQYKNIVNDLDPNDISATLISGRAITIDEKELISSMPTRRARAEKLLDILISTKREDGFKFFVLGLKNIFLEHLAEPLIDKYEEYLNAKPSTKDWLIVELSDQGRARKVTERELSQIAQQMGHNWMHLGLTLGFMQTQLEQFQASQPYYLPGQATKMLIAWKNKEGGLATVENLVRNFRIAGIDEDIYKQVILDNTPVTK